MDKNISCHECKHSVTERAYKCMTCSDCLRKDVFYCRHCFCMIKHAEIMHNTISVDYTQTTNAKLINSIIDFEKLHLPTGTDASKLFPYDDKVSAVWKRNNFSEISYQLPNEMPFKNSIPFVCDYLRMNNSLKYLATKLNLKLCYTDIIILILKYSSFDTRLFIIEQLCVFHRAIPIYFGVPLPENSLMKYYFLMHEMLHMLLPYKSQNIPFILSFGSQSCKGKTLLLNAILNTNFDCHHKAEFNFEATSPHYHNQLIQMVLGHRYTTDRDTNNEIICSYNCHVLDLHGTHDWNQMPGFFVEYMSVIIIHIDILDVDQIDSFAWPSVAFHQTATYLIFIHGEISDYDVKINLQPQIEKHFGLNKTTMHVFRTNEVLNEDNRALQLGVLSLLKQAPIPSKSLFDVSEQLIRQQSINLSTNVNTLVKSKQLLDEFPPILMLLSREDPSLDLFPLSRLKELSEKSDLSEIDEIRKDKLKQKLHANGFDHAHILLTKLAQLCINDDNEISLFEKAVLLWNTILWQQKQRQEYRSPISLLQHLEMSKERFLREFQIISKGYSNLNGRHCTFKDIDQMKTALIKIYRHSFRNQEYIEIINATSSTTYPEIFDETFSNDSEDIKKMFVIGIIGEQSGGKSFLINKVFGTKIAESKFKCTTGILATRVNITGHDSVKNIVILDTEGLLDQSKEHDEAQIFDRKMVLAVMARSHVVMINITRNVNKTMQQILEIVFYGLNKLQITNKPKIIFLFRDQDPKTMGEAGQRNHVSEVMKDIQKSCKKVNFDVQNWTNGFDIHEFPSPFVDLVVGKREISFFNNSFCQKALSLRLKIIDHLATLTPFDSFNEWLALMLELWQQINHNSNLFDYESLIHLTLEKDLETFCNRVLTEANSEMRKILDTFINKARNSPDDNIILHEIERNLLDKKDILTKNLLEQLSNEKKRLIQKHNLESFSEILFENTTSRIRSSLNLYRTDHFMEATRQFQQDELQKKLTDIPKDLIIKIREIQSVSKNAAEFETLFNDTSSRLSEEFISKLENDYRQQSTLLQKKLIKNFIDQNKIDQVGVAYFNGHINDLSLINSVQNAVLNKNPRSSEDETLAVVPYRAVSLSTATQLPVVDSSFGSAILRPIVLRICTIYYGFVRNKNNSEEQEFEKMLSFLRIEYTAFRNGPYYDKNRLPVPELANECVQHIREAIANSNIKSQQMINMWYTCYGIMLNIFCDKHYNYINNKLKAEFEQEISRTKEEVRQNIVNVSTAEEHGEALVNQIWTKIQNDAQKQFLKKFENYFSAWNGYPPSVISENCVNELFRSTNYQMMFNYIRDPTTYIKEWLRSRFNEEYQSQLAQTILSFSSHVGDSKKKFSRMILTWYNAIRASNFSGSIFDLTNSLTRFLSHGEYKQNNISLTEPAGGFSILDNASIRIIPPSADKHRLLQAIHSTSQTLLTSSIDHAKESTKVLIDNKQLQHSLFKRFYNRAKGCGTPCPYCKQICDVDNPNHTEHRTQYHLLWAFCGYKWKDTEKPGLICCTSDDAFKIDIGSLTDKDTFMPFTTHLERFNPTWKIFNRKTIIEDFQLKAYIALEEDLSKHYNFKGRADSAIRKNFLRATVTIHCYGLLVGIDYENTSNSLHGIPSRDVSCIEEQLNLSSIAYPENLRILKNNQATKQNILTTLNTVVNNMDERSTLIFYFSGHGGRTTASESYLLTSDNQTLTAKELADVVGKAKTNKIIIMLDSCYSGGMSNGFRFDSTNSKDGIHILCSSNKAQVSYQSTSDGNGFFTKYLIKGLKGEFSCQTDKCKECATKAENLRTAAIPKVTSTELVSYLGHAVKKRQDFSYSTINGSVFDISFLN